MKLTAGIVQLEVTSNKSENLKRAGEMILEAGRRGAKLIALPEMFNCPYQQEFFPLFAEEINEGETAAFLSDLARKTGAYLVGGSIPERDGDRIYNTSLTFDPQGNLIAKHRKIHLFDVSIPGQIEFRESAVLTPGNDLTVFTTEYGKFGVLICYDLRFPELFRLLVEKGITGVIVPAAFNMVTGPAHWEILFRVRAVDNQIYTFGICPARNEKAGYVAYGHSLIADPWGEIVWKAGAGVELGVKTVDLEKVAKVRRELPLLAHRRLDRYQLKEL
ncbi:MAG: carbon-nitrogen hydrolase family protein [Firmicutes bacterium]|nr:carbon-nitrogen hydrolase family protein [Bacillota bacterium]